MISTSHVARAASPGTSAVRPHGRAGSTMGGPPHERSHKLTCTFSYEPPSGDGPQRRPGRSVPSTVNNTPQIVSPAPAGEASHEGLQVIKGGVLRSQPAPTSTEASTPLGQLKTDTARPACSSVSSLWVACYRAAASFTAWSRTEGRGDGRGWARTSDLSRVKRALSH